MSESQVLKKLKMDSEVEFSHPDTMVELGMKLLNNKEDCDVYFVVGLEREKIGAHKIILKARSSVFELMFSSRRNKSGYARKGKTHEIVLEDAEPSNFRSFFEFIYANMFSATAVQAVKLLHLAQLYDVKPLVKLCEGVLAKPFVMVELPEIYVTARKYNISHALSRATLCIARCFRNLGSSPSAFEKFDEAALMLFLKRDDLCIGEAQLFSALLKWADKQIENSEQGPKPERKDILENLIPLVRFTTMTSKELATVVAPTNLLPQVTMINLFLYLNSDEANRIAIGESLSYDKARRGGGLPIRIDLYKGNPGPGREVYPGTALKKWSNQSNVIDILTFTFSGAKEIAEAELKTRIVALTLQGPPCSEGLFKNISQVKEMLPIKVAISLCLAAQYPTGCYQMFPLNDEVVVNVGKDETEVTLVKPWEISSNTLYKIRLRFLSDIYVLPVALDDGSGKGMNKLRDTRLDLFTSTALQDKIIQRSSSGIVEWSNLSMSGGSLYGILGVPFRHAYLMDDFNTMSTGLHILKALKIRD